MSLYDDLGVPEDADAVDIKKAYRKGASKAHPDRPGGDSGRMSAINRAYRVLADPDSRKHYDETGQESEGPSIEEQAIKVIVDKVVPAIGGEPDLSLQGIVYVINGLLQQHKANLRAVKGAIVRAEKRVKRIKYKGKGPNFLLLAIEVQLKAAKQQVVQLEMTIVVHETALQMMQDFEYEVEYSNVGAEAQIRAALAGLRGQ